MGRIKDITVDGSITGGEKLLATDTDFSTKNITIDTLKQYITTGSPIAYTLPQEIGTTGQVLVVPTSGTVLEWDDQASGGGTVTSITASSPLTGGTITTTGTIGLTTGNLTETTSSVLTITGGTGAVVGSGATIAVSQATTSTNGYLSSGDWNTFNDKQAVRAIALDSGTTKEVLQGDTKRIVYATNTNFDYVITASNDNLITVDSEFNVVATGAGTIRVTFESGLTVNGVAGPSSIALTQYKPTRLIKVAAATYVLG